jgi:hypothetical protein
MRHYIRPIAAAIVVALLFANSSSGSGSGLHTNAGSPATGDVTATGQSGTSSQRATATKSPTTSVNVMVDVLGDRHTISPYVYGGSYPKDSPTISDSGLTVVRWGGNATSRYNWKTFTNNAAADWYFEDFGYTEIGDGDSVKYIQDVKAAGSNPLMTMVMLPWVAKSSGWSFSVAKYGPQCAADPYNSDAGDGVLPDCQTDITGNDPTDANVELRDSPQNGDPPGTIYRDQWASALAAAFGSAPHFYNMDNEIDIWSGTHRDVHPNPSAYEEMRDTYLAEAGALKSWDANAIRFGPVSCCWWFYWNGANNNDKGAHAGVDFLPWWLNEVFWQDQLSGTRSVDVFDIHAYPDGPDTSGYTQAQKQALTLRIYRDYWDPKYMSESGSINQQWATFIQPKKRIPFRIPRMRALVNMIYPGTPLSFTEWSAAFAGESDFSTALADADAYGILGRERMYLASRWVAPDPVNSNYQALKLFRNYDGQHHSFATMSVSATNDGNPNLFSIYAALDPTGKTLTLMVINKSPQASVQTQFAVAGFTPKRVTTYTLSPKSPTTIVASSTKAWTSSRKFAPYTATLLVITGSMPGKPSADWDLNPDTIMVPAHGATMLQPKIVSGSGSVTLGTPQSDSGITLSVTQPNLTPSQNGSITVTAGSAPGFYHFTVPSTDNAGVAQTQSGWIVVGNPPATFTKTGDRQRGAPGGKLNLSVTLQAKKSGGSASGGTVLFTTDAGTLSSRLVTTDSSGNAPVVLTLPSHSGTVHVTAEGQFGLGHPVAKFTETAQ